jgi:hypothetical protein
MALGADAACKGQASTGLRLFPVRRGGWHPDASWAGFNRLDIGKINSKRGPSDSSDRNDSVLDGVLHQFGIRFYLQKLHGVVLVRGDGPRGDFKHGGCFFHGATFGQ